jgi:hypothetical protein
MKLTNNKKFLFKTLIFHPLTVLTVALVAAILFAGGSYVTFTGDLRDLLVYYFAPIAVPFVAYLFDRAQRWREVHWWIDVPVVVVSFLRALLPIPFISGHALFLTYALLTTQTRVARWTAIIVLIQVAAIKIFVWRDPTLLGGITLGILAAWLNRSRQASRLQLQPIEP